MTEPRLENISFIILETLHLSIECAAKEIIKKGNLTGLTEEEVINSIKSYRTSRKNLESCCSALMSIYRRKNRQFDLEFDYDDPYSGILSRFDKWAKKP